jgi:hypothetical protein
MSAISQSIAWWCYVPEKLTAEQFVPAVIDAGYQAIDLVPRDY